MPWLHDSREALPDEETEHRDEPWSGAASRGFPGYRPKHGFGVLPLPRNRSCPCGIAVFVECSLRYRQRARSGGTTSTWAFSGAELHAPDGIGCHPAARGGLEHGAPLWRGAPSWKRLASMAVDFCRCIAPRAMAERSAWLDAGLGPGRTAWRRGGSRPSCRLSRRSRRAGVRARPARNSRCNASPLDQEKGARAEAFALGTRFAKERMWHVEESPSTTP